MTAVRIPPVLRSNVGGAKEVAVSGTTVGEALTSLVTQHPGLREQLLTGDGELNRFVNVYLDGQDIRYLEELATPVAEHDQIIVLPAMAGG
ncbi:MAG: ubiquitin-like small modifier protein 1 [Candidatus Limnocylindrales bacterium]